MQIFYMNRLYYRSFIDSKNSEAPHVPIDSEVKSSELAPVISRTRKHIDSHAVHVLCISPLSSATLLPESDKYAYLRELLENPRDQAHILYDASMQDSGWGGNSFVASIGPYLFEDDSSWSSSKQV